MSILTQTQGAIPSGQQQTAQQGQDIISQLLSEKSKVDAEITRTIPAAITPISTAGQATPMLKGTNVPTFGQPQFAAPQGHRDARNQGIAKTIAGVGNVVSGLIKAKKDSETRVLAGKIQKVMGAQDSVAQAKAILKDDSNNQDAQAALKKAQQIINDTIGHDEKTRKQFEKAFDMNLLDPSKNKGGMEQDARKQAAKSYAEQMEQQTPARFVPNQQAIAKTQALQAQSKGLEDSLKIIVPQVIGAGHDNATVTAAQTAATQRLQSSAIAATQSGINNAATNAERKYDADQHYQATVKAAGIHAGATRYAADTHYQAVVKAANIGFEGKKYTADKAFERAIQTIDHKIDTLKKAGLNPEKVNANRIALSKSIEKKLADIDTELNTNTQMRKKADPSRYDYYDKQAQMLEAQKLSLNTRYEELVNSVMGDEKGSSGNGGTIPESNPDDTPGDPTDPNWSGYQ